MIGHPLTSQKNAYKLLNRRKTVVGNKKNKPDSKDVRKKVTEDTKQVQECIEGKQKIQYKQDFSFTELQKSQSFQGLSLFVENLDNQSSFEFSEEIMLSNPRKETRSQRQKNKINHLSIFDWMMKISKTLNLTKQTFYRGVIIMKKFMFLEQKLKQSKVNLYNANLYSLAALLISSKFQNINGNFLSKKSHIVDLSGSQNKNTMSKQCILEYQLYILNILKFEIPKNSIIVQAQLEVILNWNACTDNCFKRHQFGLIGSVFDQINQECYGLVPNSRSNLLQTFIYLIDFVIIRNIVNLRIKDIKQMENSMYFKKIISNVLYHLLVYSISKDASEQRFKDQRKFQEIFRRFAMKLGLQRQDIPIIERKSHLLSKLIYNLSKQNDKSRQLQHQFNQNTKISKNYCLCNLTQFSSKYLDIAEDIEKKERIDSPQQAQSQHNQLGRMEISFQKKQDQNDTNLLMGQSSKDKSIESQRQIQSISQIGQVQHKQKCEKCCKDMKFLRAIINQQHYIPLYVTNNSNH